MGCRTYYGRAGHAMGAARVLAAVLLGSLLAVATAAAVEAPPLGPLPEPGTALEPPAVPLSPAWGLFDLLDGSVPPGERRRLHLPAGEGFAGATVNIPVIVLRGVRPGETLCLTAGIHGDELNGIEVVRTLLERVAPRRLAGTIVAVPIVNLHGFRRGSRYLPDRRDLNRFFPGNVRGSSAARIARAIFDGIILRCGLLVDLHTGSFHRGNVPHVRGDLRQPRVLQLALGFGPSAVMHNEGLRGTLRRAATDAGIPAITFEAGEPMRFQADAVDEGVAGLERLLEWLGMVPGEPTVRAETRIFWSARWIRADHGGILRPEVELGDPVAVAERLGTVTDPIRNEQELVVSPYRGRIIGMALPQVVMPGFAAFHVGIDGPAGVAPGGRDGNGRDDDQALEIDLRPE